MPMIDVYAAKGIIKDRKGLARDLAQAIMRWEKVPVIPFFTDNTAAFVHELDADGFSTAGGGTDHVRVNVTTNAGALDREQQLGLVEEISELVASAAGDPLPRRAHLGHPDRGGSRRLGHRRPRLHQRRDRPARARTAGQGLTLLTPGSWKSSQWTRMGFCGSMTGCCPWTYENQDCSLARALEVVGERWTLLVMRDAFYGVRRFNDFFAHLDAPRPVLSTRLSALVDAGLLETPARPRARRPPPLRGDRQGEDAVAAPVRPACLGRAVRGRRPRTPAGCSRTRVAVTRSTTPLAAPPVTWFRNPRTSCWSRWAHRGRGRARIRVAVSLQKPHRLLDPLPDRRPAAG